MSWNYSDFQKWITNGCEKDIAEKIHTLNLRSNNLNTFPDSIFILTNLRELYLDNNFLRTVPVSISLLTNLCELDLSSNRLTSFARPEGLTTFPRLNFTSNKSSHTFFSWK